jgi:hypothetical protein
LDPQHVLLTDAQIFIAPSTRRAVGSRALGMEADFGGTSPTPRPVGRRSGDPRRTTGRRDASRNSKAPEIRQADAAWLTGKGHNVYPDRYISKAAPSPAVADLVTLFDKEFRIFEAGLSPWLRLS